MRHKTVKFSIQQEQQIISLYNDGYGGQIIGRMYNVSSSRINLILKKFNIPLNNNKFLPVLSVDQINNILQLYSDGINVGQIAKKFGVWPNAIKCLLKRRGVDILKCARPMFKFNDNFLISLNKSAAYFYGFVLGDGTFNTSKGTPFIKISLHKQDVCILHIFCKWLNIPVSKLYFYPKVNQYQLDIRSKNLNKVADIWGLIPNKTYDPKIPCIDDLVLIKYFIIGLIDADGHINNRNYNLQLVGNKFIMDWVEFKIKQLGYSGSIKRYGPSDAVWSRLVISKKSNVLQLGRLLDIINCDFLLERKWKNLKNAIIHSNA